MRTTGEVARELGVSIRTIQEAVRSGKVASTRWGRKYLLPPECLFMKGLTTVNPAL